MQMTDVQKLEDQVTKEWNRGGISDMQNAYEMALDELGYGFYDYLVDNDYQEAGDVNDEIDDDILDLEQEIEDAQADGLDSEEFEEKRDDLVDKKDDIDMDGGPIWDVSNGADEAENVFVNDFIDLIEAYLP